MTNIKTINIVPKKGLEKDLPTGAPADLLYSTDTEKLFYSGKNSNIELAKKKDVDAADTALENRINNVQTDITNINNSIENLELIDVAIEDIAIINNTLKGHEERLDDHELRLDDHEQRLDNHEQRLNTAETNISNVNVTLQHHQQEIDNSKMDINNVRVILQDHIVNGNHGGGGSGGGYYPPEETDIRDSFKQFKVGGVDILKKTEDATENTREYLRNKYLRGVEVSASHNTLKKELTGIVAEKADGVSGILSVVQTKIDDSGLVTTTITEITSATQLSSAIIKDVTHITLVISSQSLSYYKQNPTQAENGVIAAIGIRITFDDNIGVFLERFNVGDFDVLSVEDNDATESVGKFIENHVVPPIASTEIVIEDILKGLDVIPNEEYLDWHLTLLRCVGVSVNDGVSWTPIEVHALPLADYASFKVPTWKRDSVVVVISNEPFSTIQDGTATEDVYFKAFGGTFFMEKPPEVGGANEYFDEYRVSDVDMLPLASDETEQVKSYVNGNLQYVKPSSTYETTENLQGLFVQLKEEYADYHLTLFEYTKWNHGGEIHEGGYFGTWEEALDYNPEYWDFPGDNISYAITLIISDVPFSDLTPGNIDDVFIKAFGVTVKKVDDPESGGSSFGTVEFWNLYRGFNYDGNGGHAEHGLYNYDYISDNFRGGDQEGLMLQLQDDAVYVMHFDFILTVVVDHPDYIVPFSGIYLGLENLRNFSFNESDLTEVPVVIKPRDELPRDPSELKAFKVTKTITIFTGSRGEGAGLITRPLIDTMQGKPYYIDTYSSSLSPQEYTPFCFIQGPGIKIVSAPTYG